MVLIFYLSSQSTTPSPPGLSQELAAIAGHVFAYAALAALLLFGVAGLRRPSTGALIGVILVATLYGITDEFHQSFVPGRRADPLDVVADFVGATIGAAAWFQLVTRFCP